MNPISTEQLLESLHWRYATKQFDASKKIPVDLWKTLEEALVLTPSSYGLQPWQFFVITDSDILARLRVHSWNQPQVTDCSHYVVFAIPEKIDTAYVEKFLARIADVRGVTLESLAFYRDMMMSDIINGPRSQWAREWAARQVYIALGNLMTSAALLGVDACPMEGLDPREYDAILDLPAKGFNTVVACCVGYRSASDKYATTPKVRFDKSDLIRHI